MENIDFSEYIKSELFIIVPVLYIIGIFIKRTQIIKDNYIPISLGILSILMCLMYFLAHPSDGNIFNTIFVSIIQGVLIASCPIYAHQVIKQSQKEK